MKSLFDQHLRKAIDSLAMEPDDWEIDGYTAINRRRMICIWHENRYYGVELQVGGIKYGGVTTASSFFGGLILWRRRICRAVDRCSEQQRKMAMGEAV